MPAEGLAPRHTVGRYQIVEEIGRGTMGVVYRGFDPVIGRPVALKTIAVGAIAEDVEEFRRRLFREASAAGALTHPNIVTIHDVVHESQTTAVAMELVEGETLAATMARRAPLPLDEALTLIEQICAGLDYAGAKGIVHRDIKPANILVGLDGRPRIADFGIARLPASNLTMTGAILGSSGYMSPEQVLGLPLDPRSDLFSAATVFYEMVTGRNPFSGAEAANTMHRIVHDAPAPLRSLNPALTPALDAVMGRALAKTPAQRFRSGAEFVCALRASADGTPIARVHPSRARPASQRAGLVLGVVGLAGATGFGVYLWLGAPRPAAPNPTRPATVSPAAAPAAASAATPRRPTVESRKARAAVSRAPLVEAAGRPPEITEPSTPSAPTAPEASPPPPHVEAAVPGRPATTPPPAAPVVSGTLAFQFQGEAFPFQVYDGDQLIAGDPIRLPAGRHRIRLVNNDLFLNRSFETVTIAAGAEATLMVFGPGSAVVNVKGENYAGVQIFVDGRQLPLPYPAQIPRIASGSHVIRFAWVSGSFAGKALAETFSVRPGEHVLVRAVPDDSHVVVQQIR